MVKRTVKRFLVIDACVARACGTSGKLSALNCLRFVEAIRANQEVGLALSDDLSEEWKRHRSRAFARWLRIMWSQKRCKEFDELVDLEPDIEALTFPAHEKAPLHKDRHLFELSIAASKAIASHDETLFGLACRACETVAALRGHRWLNPIAYYAEACAWIDNPADPNVRLVNSPE